MAIERGDRLVRRATGRRCVAAGDEDADGMVPVRTGHGVITWVPAAELEPDQDATMFF